MVSNGTGLACEFSKFRVSKHRGVQESCKLSKRRKKQTKNSRRERLGIAMEIDGTRCDLLSSYMKGRGMKFGSARREEILEGRKS